MHVNLLPFSFQRSLLVRRLVRKWTVTWTICLVAIGLFVGVRYFDVVRAQEGLQQAEMRCADIRAVVTSNLQLEASLARMLDCRKDLTRLEPDQDALAAIAVVAEAVRATQGRAQIDTLQFLEPRTFSATPAAANGSAQPAATGTITFNGIAADDESVATLIEAIHRVPGMLKVELRSSSAVESDEADHRRFEIVCGY